jgi:MFS transporter, PPP family, 3-phenylpropionic acid transporter
LHASVSQAMTRGCRIWRFVVERLSRNEFFKKYPVDFIILFGFTLSAGAIYNTFLPVYLHQAGFTDTLVGTLLAIGPFIAFLAQPFWGLVGDRARSKNTILRILLAGSALSVLLFPILKNFTYLFLVISVFTFFNTSMLPMQDAITLESIENSGWRYGTIRMAGTIGFAIMSVVVGLLSNWNIYVIFPLYSLVAFIGFFMTYRIPAVSGHQAGSKPVAPWKLLKNKKLVVLMSFSFVLFITLGYYYSFFPIYYKQMGASNLMVGISMLCSSSAEIPFLLFANKIVNKLGIRKTLICSAIVMGIRWILLYFISNIYAIPFINMLHGFSFIVCTYCLVMYINQEAPRELKASGQTLLALLAQGISRIIGSVLGGVVSDALGVRTVFLYSFIINILAVVVFGGIWYMERRKRNLRLVS